MKFLQLHLPATNDSGSEAFFRDAYAGTNRFFAAYQALWPDRYSRSKLADIFQVIHPYYKRAQYDLVPSIGELGYFDTERFLRYQNPLADQVWITLDANQTATEHGSYAALVGMGSYQGTLKVLSVRRGRWRQDVMHQQLLDFYQHIARLTGILPEAVVVESAAGGYGVIDLLSAQLPIVPLYPRGSKEDRASSVCFLVNTGRVAIPEAAPWVKDFVDELQNFPLCSASDQVDAFVHALAYASRPAEFKPRVAEYVRQYDALEEYNQSSSSFRDMDSFDSHMSEAESYLRWKDKQ
jgi:predicted phage terminase large subunit-like protein